MTSSWMFFTRSDGKPHTYSDKLETPVPRVTYRCKATARDTTKKAHTHLCKIVIDHDGDHACLCGKTWEKGNL